MLFIAMAALLVRIVHGQTVLEDLMKKRLLPYPKQLGFYFVDLDDEKQNLLPFMSSNFVSPTRTPPQPIILNQLSLFRPEPPTGTTEAIIGSMTWAKQ
jgi:hypothetical protein